ncbi:hypothetical protein GUITHDRAFT_115028 [Guillardia theta CCMP2712]|uniref:BZIP domain-containing protein n=1 Tax=Guillardia theta (strain CCMP2712) TaxID=905079 RepID=L1ISP4_GUITC|nr:hypothetical protein GUITHDRAFT_115028 [Guillardia theta CCMP2712]EKX38924.1 hypothetical protein GUITHDRAFT_115028 [Guillardia theta CCMP2712]|eukprot:XP_005825904.1 hypothetical protein GUITHDRAFT_115028 [Guillardia theta CCMP2712]
MRRPSQPHSALEQELAMLLHTQKQVEEGYPTMYGQEYEMTREIRNRVRTIKNRLAAKKSRDQARTHVQKLESGISEISSRNETLSKKLEITEADNVKLREEVSRLKERVAELERSTNPCTDARTLVNSGADVSAKFKGEYPIHLAALYGCSLPAPFEGQPCVLQVPASSDAQARQSNMCMHKDVMEGAERFEQNVAAPPPATEPFVTVKSERRRAQNRDAQRRHRERQMFLQSREPQAALEYDMAAYRSDLSAMHPELLVSAGAGAGAAFRGNAEDESSQTTQDNDQDSSNYSSEEYFEPAGKMEFDPTSFPESLSRKGSFGSLILSRRPSDDIKEVDMLLQANMQYMEPI